MHREGIQPQPVLPREAVLTQGQTCRLGFTLHEQTGIKVREQQCHAQAGEKDTGVFLLRAMLLGLAAQTQGSFSRAFGGRALGIGKPLT